MSKQTNNIDVTTCIRVQPKNLREKRLNAAKKRFAPIAPCMLTQNMTARVNRSRAQESDLFISLNKRTVLPSTSKNNQTYHLKATEARRPGQGPRPGLGRAARGRKPPGAAPAARRRPSIAPASNHGRHQQPDAPVDSPMRPSRICSVPTKFCSTGGAVGGLRLP